jgi:DNA-directed RNA polymerase
LGEKWPVNLACDSDFHINRRVFFYMPQICDMGHGFTSLPKEGRLWIFSPQKSDGFGRVRTRDLGY